MSESAEISRVNVLNPYGEPENIPHTELPRALQVGYRVLSPQEVDHLSDQATYGEGMGPALKAMAAGAARSASFGLSDELLTKSGLVKPETLSKLSEFNPGSTAVGEIGGIGGSLLLAPEMAGAKAAEGALTAADALNPVRAVSKIGRQVSEGAQGLLASGENAGVASRILSKAGSQGLGSAVEGAAYGLGQSVSEHALGDPDLNAQKVLSNIGQGALFGGALGSALGAVEEGVPAVLKPASSALEKTKEFIFGPEGEVGPLGRLYAKASSFVSGRPEENIIEGLRNRVNTLKSVEENNQLKKDFTETLQNQFEAVEKAAAKTFGELRPVETENLLSDIEERDLHLSINQAYQALEGTLDSISRDPKSYSKNFIDRLSKIKTAFKDSLDAGDSEKIREAFEDFKDALSRRNFRLGNLSKNRKANIKSVLDDLDQVMDDDDALGTQARDQWNKITNSFNRTIKAMRAEPDIYPASYARKLEMIAEQLPKKIGDEASASEIFNQINEIKHRLDTRIKYGKIPSAADQDAESLIRDLRHQIKTNLEDSKIWGEAGSRQAKFNEAYNIYSTNKKEFINKFMRKVQTRSGAIGFKIDPVKVSTFLTQIDNLKGEERGEILKAFMDSSENLIGEISHSMKSAPGRIDTKALSELVQKNRGVSQNVQDQAELWKNLGMLGSGAHNTYLGEEAAIFSAVHSHPLVGAMIESVNLLRNPALTIQRLAKVERMVQKTNAMISQGAKAIFKTSLKAADALSGYGAQKLIRPTEHKETIQAIRELNSNPEKLIDHLEHATAALYDVAPETTQGIHETAARAVQFLAEKSPDAGPSGPLNKQYPLSSSAQAQFHRYYESVENPIGILDSVKNCTIRSDQIEALQRVYPKLYDEMREQVMGELIEHQSRSKKLDYKTKMALSVFLGEDLDSSLTQGFVQSNQMALLSSGQTPTGANQGSVRLGGAKNLKLAEGLLTPMQSASARGTSSSNQG